MAADGGPPAADVIDVFIAVDIPCVGTLTRSNTIGCPPTDLNARTGELTPPASGSGSTEDGLGVAGVQGGAVTGTDAKGQMQTVEHPDPKRSPARKCDRRATTEAPVLPQLAEVDGRALIHDWAAWTEISADGSLQVLWRKRWNCLLTTVMVSIDRHQPPSCCRAPRKTWLRPCAVVMPMAFLLWLVAVELTQAVR